MGKLLTLVAFAVTDHDPAHVQLTVTGAANLIPKGIESTKGTKGKRVIEIASDAAGPLYEMGAALHVNGATEMADDDADYFGWFKTNFVPTANGGELAAEGEEAAEAADDGDATGDAAAPEPEAEAAPTEPPTLEEQLGSMLAKDVKNYAKNLGLKPGTSKAATILVIMAYDGRHATALKNAKLAAEFVKANSANRDELDALRQVEADGKARKSVLANIAKALTALDASEAPAPEPEPEVAAAPESEAPPVEAPPVEKAKKARASGLDDDTKAKAAEIVQGVQEPLKELVTLIGRKRAQTVLRRLVGALDAGGDVNIDVILGGGSTGERKAPICHVLNATHSTTKRHRDDRGVCTYTIKCIENGGYELTGLEGNNTTVTVGDKFKHGLELIQKLTGRETGIPTVARWFGLI